MTKAENKETRSRLYRFASAALCAIAIIAPFAAPANAASQPAKYVCRWYQVRRGDQLGKLSEKYDVDILTLRRVNGLRSTKIYIGQRLCIPTTVVAPPPHPPGPGPASGPWYAQYWNNTAQSGAPAATRNDAAINFAWGYGSPDPARVFSDNFSARWTRPVGFETGIYRFTVNSDDGFRLYVDGNLVLDSFTFEGNQTRSVDVSIPAGARVVQLDYVEKTGLALVKLNYYKVSGPSPAPVPTGTSWHADYFNNNALAGSPVLVGTSNDLNFNWGLGGPGGSVPTDNWSARFTQARSFVGGTYRFVVQVDDGVRVYVDNTLVINEWREQSYRTFTGDIVISPGDHTIRVEYLEVGNAAALRMYMEKR